MKKAKQIKKSVAVIGEGETEWFYIDAVRTGMRFPFTLSPSFPQHSDIMHMKKEVEKCIGEGYDYVVCLIDMDRPLAIESEMEKLKSMKKAFSAKIRSGNVIILETNPCTEFWFLIHFLTDIPNKTYKDQEEVIRELRKYIPGYEKTKKYFKSKSIFETLKENGNLEQAIENSEKLYASIDWEIEYRRAYSQIHKLFHLLLTLKNTHSG